MSDVWIVLIEDRHVDVEACRFSTRKRRSLLPGGSDRQSPPRRGRGLGSRAEPFDGPGRVGGVLAVRA